MIHSRSFKNRDFINQVLEFLSLLLIKTHDHLRITINSISGKNVNKADEYKKKIEHMIRYK